MEEASTAEVGGDDVRFWAAVKGKGMGRGLFRNLVLRSQQNLVVTVGICVVVFLGMLLRS